MERHVDWKEQLKEISEQFMRQEEPQINNLSEIEYNQEMERKPDVLPKEKDTEQPSNYLDLKKEVKELDEKMKEMRAALDKELSVAKMNGMSQDAADRIFELQGRIEQTRQLSEKHLSEISSIEHQIKEHMSAGFRESGEKIREAVGKAKEGLFDKTIGAVAATKALCGKVREANKTRMEKGQINRDTFSTILMENVNQVGRNWMAFNYGRDHMISNALDKAADTVEKAFEHVSNVKEAFKDLGRALTGKERQNSKGELSPGQLGIVNGLRGISSELKNEMQNIKKDFEVSKNISILNVKGAIENREESRHDMKPSNSLRKRFEAAKEASIASKTDIKGIEGKKMEQEI